MYGCYVFESRHRGCRPYGSGGYDRNKLIPTARWVSAPCSIVVLGLPLGSATTSTVPEMAWVRTDGRKIADDPTLLQQEKVT